VFVLSEGNAIVHFFFLLLHFDKWKGWCTKFSARIVKRITLMRWLEHLGLDSRSTTTLQEHRQLLYSG